MTAKAAGVEKLQRWDWAGTNCGAKMLDTKNRGRTELDSWDGRKGLGAGPPQLW